jgi:hypothetical protein
LRALNRIIRKKGKPSKREIKPSLNWSKLGNIRSWISESSPSDWSI